MYYIAMGNTLDKEYIVHFPLPCLIARGYTWIHLQLAARNQKHGTASLSICLTVGYLKIQSFTLIYHKLCLC